MTEQVSDESVRTYSSINSAVLHLPQGRKIRPRHKNDTVHNVGPSKLKLAVNIYFFINIMSNQSVSVTLCLWLTGLKAPTN